MLWWGLIACCGVCYCDIYFHDVQTLKDHDCLDQWAREASDDTATPPARNSPTYESGGDNDSSPEEEPPTEGRGDLLSCGDVEPNPGPEPPSTCPPIIRYKAPPPHTLGRGTLLTCGDVEENPGPKGGKAEPERPGMV